MIHLPNRSIFVLN